MKSARAFVVVLILVASPWARSQIDENVRLDEQITAQILQRQEKETPKSLKLDPKRIVNASNSFLKEREPEMTAEEYALYEKVVTMLAERPLFALKLLEAMIGEEEKPSPAFEFILGNAYYAAGDYAKSETSYRAAVERFPTFQRAWSNLGVLYYSTERFADAARCFSKSIGLGDRDSTTFGLLAYSLERDGNVISAEVAYMQALSSDPGNVEWKEGLLRICIQGKQFTRAESIVKNLIKDHPKDTRFWLTYANILLSQRRKLEAMAVLEACSGFGVAGVDELVLLGDLYAEHQLYVEATAIYQKLLTPSPETGHDKLLHFAQVLLGAEKIPEAERVLAAIKGELPASTQLNFLQTKADLLAAKKQWAEARRELNSLLEIAPLNGRALLALGRTYTAEEDTARAIIAFEAAWRVPDSTYRASLELANLQLKNREYALSVKYLEKALSIRKTDTVEDYLARVRTLISDDS